MELDTIVFVGNALVDYAVKCEKSLLEKYNLVIDNQYECNDSQVTLFDDITNLENVLKIPGGSAQNSARICAAISRKHIKYSADVFMIASIGNDENGRFLIKYLEAVGVKPIYQVSAKNPTGTTAALVTKDGSRTLVANIAASSDLDTSILHKDVSVRALNSSEIIFVEGYILTNCSEVAFNLAKFAMNHAKLFAFGISAAFVAKERAADVMNLLPFIDVLFGNLKEATELARHLNGINPDKLSPEEMVESILKFGQNGKTTEIPIISGVNQLVIITNGPNPIVWGKRSSDSNVEVNQFVIENVEVTGDTIGAGDTFAAGVLMSLLKKFGIIESIAMGNQCSSLSLQHTGCFIDT